LNETEDYNLLRKTINIHVLNFDYLKEKDHSNFFHIINPKYNCRHHEHFELHYIELPKYIKDVREPQNKLDFWTSFLTTADNFTWDALPGFFKADSDVKTDCKVL
jgi:predicted transposase/invertase (TIGR01784 family)